MDDLKKMVQNMPTKIIDFKHKTNTGFSSCFGAFQVVLSNGIASPVMKGKSETDTGLQSLPIKDYSQVKIINGTKQENGNY